MGLFVGFSMMTVIEWIEGLAFFVLALPWLFMRFELTAVTCMRLCFDAQLAPGDMQMLTRKEGAVDEIIAHDLVIWLRESACFSFVNAWVHMDRLNIPPFAFFLRNNDPTESDELVS